VESDYIIDSSHVFDLVVWLVGEEYHFLAHDFDPRSSHPWEKEKWISDAHSVLQRLESRGGRDWFHLVQQDWDISPPTSKIVMTQNRGAINFVAQRDWGPYIDIEFRPLTARVKVSIHLYPRFWHSKLETEVTTPPHVKAAYQAIAAMLRRVQRKKN
jgi:hypothetical protein